MATRFVRLALAASILPAHALAGATQFNRIDAYYAPDVELEAEDDDGKASIDGDGWGVEGAVSFSDRAFFTVQYQSDTVDDVGGEIQLDQTRFGVGMQLNSGPSPAWYLRAEYIQLDMEATVFDLGSASADSDGFGAHLGVYGENGQWAGYAEIGYASVEDADGFEGVVGGLFRISERFGLFAAYRYTQLDDDDVTLTLSGLRAGLRFSF